MTSFIESLFGDSIVANPGECMELFKLFKPEIGWCEAVFRSCHLVVVNNIRGLCFIQFREHYMKYLKVRNGYLSASMNSSPSFSSPSLRMPMMKPYRQAWVLWYPCWVTWCLAICLGSFVLLCFLLYSEK